MADATKIQLLADYIEAHEEMEFNMASLAVPNDCGTPGCIAGFASVLFDCHAIGVGWSSEQLRKYLSLEDREVNGLFFPEEEWADGPWYTEKLFQLTRKGAVAMLRRFAETGEILWKGAEQ